MDTANGNHIEHVLVLTYLVGFKFRNCEVALVHCDETYDLPVLFNVDVCLLNFTLQQHHILVLTLLRLEEGLKRVLAK